MDGSNKAETKVNKQTSLNIPVVKYSVIALLITLPIAGFYLGSVYGYNTQLSSAQPATAPSPTPYPQNIPLGFTMSIEELLQDNLFDQSITTIERDEYEVPINGVNKKVAGSKFTFEFEDVLELKVKNRSEYLRSLGFNPDQPIKIVEEPGYTVYGFLLSYGKLHRIHISEGSFTHLSLFLSDPFMID